MVHIVATPLQSVSVAVLSEPVVGVCPLKSWGHFRSISMSLLFYLKTSFNFYQPVFKSAEYQGVSEAMLFSTGCLWWAWRWEIGVWLLQFCVMSPRFHSLYYTLLQHHPLLPSLCLMISFFITFACMFYRTSTAGSRPVYPLIG